MLESLPPSEPVTASPSAAAVDRNIVEGLHRGDPAVLDGLLDQYWTPLVTYTATLLRSWDAAEDVVQETFVRIWERRESWSTTGSVRALLFQIARNLALDETRRRDRHLTLLDGQGPMVRRITTPAEELEGAELEAAYREALASLPERRREVFLLSRQHDLSYREIADTMDISPQTVANQLSAALAELRRSLEPFLG